MKFLLLIAFSCSFYFLSLFIHSVHAQEDSGSVVQCGAAIEGKVAVESFKYCNIHQRRIDYEQNRAEYKKNLNKRRENYRAPAREAYQAHLENRAEYYEELIEKSE